MRNTVLLGLIALSLSMFAQELVIIHYDNDWRVCKKDKAIYYKVFNLSAQGKIEGKVQSYTMKDELKWEGYESYIDYASSSKDEVYGLCTWYHGNGNKESEANYEENKLMGTKTEWYESGNIKLKEEYKNGKLEGKSIMYFENGAIMKEAEFVAGKKENGFSTYWPDGVLKRKDIYKDDKLLEGNCFDATGKNIPYFNYEIMPEYPGGQSAMMKFISNQVEYPALALAKGIKGRVIVKFIVDTVGKVSNLEIVQSVDFELDAEAIRVVKKLARWKPGRLDGVPASVNFLIPIKFGF